MSEDPLSCIYGANRLLVRKRLAGELRFLVKWQAVALFVAALGLSHFTGYIFLTISGTIVFYVLAFWTFYRLAEPSFFPFSLTYTPFLSDSIRSYAGFGICLLILPFTRRNPWIVTHTYICLFVFLLYCVIPQFFIARWLAKKAEDGTM